MLDTAVIDEPSTAAATLEPVRARLLHELAEPASASTLAAKLGLSRQKVNYYLRGLEEHGLIELVEERRKGNMTERVMRAIAEAYVISPSASGPVAPDPSRSPDRLSARWLLAVAARLVQDVGALIGAGAKTGKRVATLAIDGEIRFASAAERSAFAQELSDAVSGLVAKYHDENAAGGRGHRLVVALHPSMDRNEEGPDGG
ncbi:DNA-binding transcriptional ArsR family regulator [Lipingzhangella halophila]|uniref:DNA-binding transcriptional ArsR family regulator n=1 Tax=Lipingzhangella halophila TaxID=1783352 RepID=A0A7W7W1P7_9ACTN|nr:helix-turn-helix domain-containing protein [Lipingzhangella halophila]MBB4930538.1 DNA-binding transcriptional ArsR family regulator [Lipingzhangella halophila]